MAKQLQIRGGTTVQHSTFTGALREITIDTDKDVVVVHDGTTVGGFPLAKQTSVDSKVTKVTSTDNAVVRFSGTTGDVQNSGVIIDDNNNVGIGVTPSAWGGELTRAIEIGTATDNGTIWSSLNESHSHIGIGANFYMDSSFTPKYKASYAASQYRQANGNHYWKTAPSGTAGNAITWNTAMTLDASGNLLLQSGTGGLGYGTGAGGAVTQLTSKSTAVTLNKPSGQITMNNAALAAGASVTFDINNSLFKVLTDTCLITPFYSSVDPSSYRIECIGNGGGSSIRVKVTNISGSSLSQEVQFRFVIIKGAVS